MKWQVEAISNSRK